MATFYLDAPLSTCPVCPRTVSWYISHGYAAASCVCGWRSSDMLKKKEVTR